MRRLSLVAKDGDGAEAGKAELPLVVSGELVVGEATVRVRGGEAAGVTAKLAYPEPMGKHVTLTSGATLEARPKPECCSILSTQSTGALLQSRRTGGPCPDLITGLLCMRSPDMWGRGCCAAPATVMLRTAMPSAARAAAACKLSGSQAVSLDIISSASCSLQRCL